MPLIAGARLGPYEIIALVGAGGMGEVYRARDTRLDRSVAIKIVRAATPPFGGSTLEQEARAVAALNHPHICALHDVGRDRDTAFLVMEYLSGTTLSAKLVDGPLPPRDVVRYSIQIAEALDHAHRNGIVHRDLKPSNIMLTKSGVKVLDFGLATLHAAAPVQVTAPADDVASTVKQPLTSDGTLVGTVHYMSPERLEGQDASVASDLFAFGAVMYEMATGRRPFASGSPAGVIAAIIRSEPPPPSSLQPALPAPMDWVIQKCLAKNPEARWQAAGDVVEVLRWIARTPDHAAPVKARRSYLVPIGVALASAVIGGALVAGLMRGFRATAPESPPLTFSVFPPPNGGFTPTPSSVPTPQFALSPNGRRLAYIASVAPSGPQIWVRALDSLTAEPLPGTQGAEYPFWSPDSSSLGFFANGSLKRVDLAGGPARVLAPAPNGRGGAWSHDGVILFSPSTQGGLYRIPAGGGDATPLTTLEPSRYEASHRWPQFLPDDRHFLYFVQSTFPGSHGIFYASLDAPVPAQQVVATGLNAAYVPPDHLLYIVDEALMSTRFDWQTGHVLGDAFRIVSPVSGSSNFFAAFSASETGVLTYASTAATSDLVWRDRAGEPVGSPIASGEFVDFRLSPNDEQLAVAEVDPQNHRPDIRVLDLTRGAKVRLTYDAATDASPIWSRDGQRIVYRSNRTGLHDIYIKAANGAGPNDLLFQSKSAKYPTDWMPDGTGIVYHTYQRGTGSDIWLMSADGTQSRPLVQTAFDEMQGQISADGQWLAYTSTESGAAEVYVRSLTDPNTRWQVSAGGGSDPRWRGDSGELFYVSADFRFAAVAFENRGPSAPRPLFRARITPPGDPYLSNYDVTMDGQRFLLKVPVHDVTSTPIHVLTNWFAAAKRGTL